MLFIEEIKTKHTPIRLKKQLLFGLIIIFTICLCGCFDNKKESELNVIMEHIPAVENTFPLVKEHLEILRTGAAGNQVVRFAIDNVETIYDDYPEIEAEGIEYILFGEDFEIKPDCIYFGFHGSLGVKIKGIIFEQDSESFVMGIFYIDEEIDITHPRVKYKQELENGYWIIIREIYEQKRPMP